MRRRIALLDYGAGNLRSAERALRRVGAEVTVTADRSTVSEADGLVVPGVGAFAACMEGLRRVGGDVALDRRLSGGRPVLGICVGMQVLFERGSEHGTESEGCGQWPGTVDRLTAEVVPHMGWNTVRPAAGSSLFAGIERERFYFVHSYAARDFPLSAESSGPLQPPLVGWTDYGGDRFVSAVENAALTATQFHPEKSGDAGAQLLRNWLDML